MKVKATHQVVQIPVTPSDRERQLAWMVRYITEEDFPKKHIEALCHIVGLFNDCKESEEEIFNFAHHLFEKYAGEGRE